MKENTTAIVVERDGKYLLVLRGHGPEKGVWAVPGGHADEGETVHQCAVREAHEEVGEIEVEKEPFLVFEHPFGSPDHIHRCHTFYGKAKGKLRAGTDAEKLGWFTPEEMESLELAGYTRTIFKEIFKSSKTN